MMRIFLASKLFDLDGHITIIPLPDTDLGETSRRVNKEKTLDGGVAVSDGGHSFGDPDFTLVWRTGDPAYEEKVKALVRTHSHVYCSTKDGCFLVTPGRYGQRARRSTLQLTVRSREDAA